MKHSARRRRWAAILILASIMTMSGSVWAWSVATGSTVAHATVHRVSDGPQYLGPPWG
jgi:hypothetical protein